ncbi:MAG: NAD(P)-dependent oxidoreductase, partial [Flavobacteriaceae bacterium]|nr:NAD(P)-dependent oxidoreductase [Flavobacteriaceae bacterium]
ALFTGDNANEKVLTALKDMGIRYICLRSAGFDHIDLEAARSLGIKVARVPEYSPNAIAEHSVAILLALIRKLPLAIEQFQQQDFRLNDVFGFNLYQKTVGIIGLGKIGLAFAKIMLGFECNVLAYDPEDKPEATALGIRCTDFKTLIRNSDVISINCPLNEHTKHLFNKSVFNAMKSGAILLNTARGSVINTGNLIEVLENKHLAGAALDVYEHEKGMYFYEYLNQPIKDKNFNLLKSFPNVVMTAHQAFLTKEALTSIAETTCSNLDSFEIHGYSENDLV